MSLADVQLHLVDSIDDALALKRWLGERRDVLALDVETEGLKWWRDRVRLVQLGDANDGWAVPWQLWGGVVEECLRSYEGRLVFHHYKFDAAMIEHWSAVDGFPITLPLSRVDDTMIMAHVLDPRQSMSLKNLASRFVDAKAATASRVLDAAMSEQRWTWATVSVRFQPYWAYGALDTVLTARLWEVLKPQVDADCPRAYDLELAVTECVRSMARRGCRIDTAYTRQRLEEFTGYVERSADWCQQHYGVQPGQDQAVIARLQADGCELTKKTKSGARLALDREVLESLDHPLAAVVLQRRRVQKLASAYLENFLELQVDEIVHPGFNEVREKDDHSHYGARTGRMSVTEPALQTLPRRSEANPLAITVRNCVAARPDHTLVMADFDQIEMRLTAHFAGDRGLAEAFEHGDFFTNVARELYADPALEKADARRQLTKNGMYALTYGAGAEKIALTTKTALEQVHAFLGNLGQRFPGIKAFQSEVANRAYQRHHDEGEAYVRSPLTGRRYAAPSRDKAYVLTNYLIQGTAGEILKMKDLELQAAGLGEFMTLNVHDEVLLDCPDDQLAEVKHVVERVMNDPNLISVPLTAAVQTAERWGDASK